MRGATTGREGEQREGGGGVHGRRVPGGPTLQQPTVDDATRREEGRKEAGGAAAHVAPAAAAVRGAGIARPPDRAAHAHGPEVHLLNKCRGKLATEGQENFAPELQLNISGLDHALEEVEGGGGVWGEGGRGGGDLGVCGGERHPPPTAVRHPNPPPRPRRPQSRHHDPQLL